MLSLLLLATTLSPKPAAPADVAAINRAMETALRCTRSPNPSDSPAPECLALQSGSAERVRWMESKPTGEPNVWTPSLALQRADGGWLELGTYPHQAFHGVVWVPEAQLYVGYTSWYGEQGATLIYDPRGDAPVHVKGTPTLSPDGALMAAFEVDLYDDGQLRFQLFSMGPDGPTKLQDERRETSGQQADLLAFAGDEVALWLDLQSDQPQVVRVGISQHIPTPLLLKEEDCLKSETARHTTGDQLFLRSLPSRSGEVISALPWGMCVQALHTHGDWELVRAADQVGWVFRKLLAETRPAPTPLPDHMRGGYCVAAMPREGETGGYPGVQEALNRNQQAGLPGYYLRPFYDDYCVGLRPTEGPTLSDLERSADQSLPVRLATWTLALAPESAYRHHSSAALLNESPLFRPLPEQGGPAPSEHIATVLAEHFGKAKGTQPAPSGVHLLPIVPDGDGILFHGGQAGETLGTSGSGFPAGRFQLTQDLSAAVFDRGLPGAVLNPCTGAFLPTQVEALRYEPATGRLRAKVDPAALKELQGCADSHPFQALVHIRFLLLIDESPGSPLLEAVSTPPTIDDKTPFVPKDYEPWARQLTWSPPAAKDPQTPPQPELRLRSLTEPDCGYVNASELIVTQGEARYVLRTMVWETWDCGA